MAKGKVHERRRAPRLPVQSQAEGEGGRRIEASLVNLSAVGALIEHAGPPRPIAPYLLTFSWGGEILRLRVRIVWYTVMEGRAGESHEGPMYRSGVEFQDLTEAESKLLAGWIGRLEEVGGTPTPDFKLWLIEY